MGLPSSGAQSTVAVKSIGLILIGIVIATAVLAVFYEYSFTGSVNPQHFNPSDLAATPMPVGRLVLSVVGMIAGIVSGAAYESVRKRTHISSWREELANAFRGVQLLKSLLAAPIIYSGVYLAAKAQPDVVLATLFAFENGFFCDALMRIEEKRRRKPGGSSR